MSNEDFENQIILLFRQVESGKTKRADALAFGKKIICYDMQAFDATINRVIRIEIISP